VENLLRGERTFVALETSGYLQTVDLDSLLKLSCKRDLILRLLVKPADHLLPVLRSRRFGVQTQFKKRTGALSWTHSM
jgi:hypothetical protein